VSVAHRSSLLDQPSPFGVTPFSRGSILRLPRDPPQFTTYNSTPLVIIIIIVTVLQKSYSVYKKYYSKQGEKIVVLVRILNPSNSKLDSQI
jgi:hypothetical protein